jgi:hypothetical protein
MVQVVGALLFLFAAEGWSQNLPGVGSDRLQKTRIPVVKERTDPPPPLDAEERRGKTLAELRKLMQEGHELEQQLERDGSGVLNAKAFKRLDDMQKSLHAVRALLKSR